MSRSSLQEERSAETRRRLLNAAIACLSERGYTNTTTAEIAGRAGVSRGAQVHHFRHKEELVICALEHLCARRLADLEEAVARLGAGSFAYRLARLLDSMWSSMCGASFYAWLELVIAGRTEPMLRAAVREVSGRLASGLRKTLGQFLADACGEPGRGEQIERVVEVVFGKLDSMALERAMLGANEPDPPETARSLQDLEAVVHEILGSGWKAPERSRGTFDE